METTQPRRVTPADGPQGDRVRDAMRYHDERLEHDGQSTAHKPERNDTLEPDEPRKREQAEESEEA
jgi:hypothetical protein